jgi:hypothetical protein
MADNLHFSLRRGFEFTCDVKSFLNKNSNRESFYLSPFSSCLLCMQTTLYSFHHDKNALNDHNVGHISSPPLILTLKTPASFRPPLSPSSTAPAPSEQPSSSGHHRLPSNHLRSNPQVLRDGTTAAVNLAAAPATQTSPHTSIALKLQSMPSKKQEGE